MRLPPETCWLLLWLPSLAAQPAGGERGEEEAAAVSVSTCQVLKEMKIIKASLSGCYCYNQNSQVKWKYIWSTVQVKINSSDLFNVVYITERYNCQYPETILSIIRCMIHNFWTPEESNDITITIHPYGQTVCFSVKPARKIFIYTISVKQNIVDFKLVFVFVVGIFLFFYAKTLSRSPVFFYSSGTVLGVLMTLVFVLLLVKKFIPKYSTFWALMLGCWFASVYILGQLMEELKRLWYEGRICVLGYILTVGCVSFAVCYKHGPLVEERSVVLLAWLLRLLSLLLVYMGVSAPQFACTAALLLFLSSGSRCYPRSVLACVGRKMKKWFTSEKPAVKFLTEDEYREQADAATTCALEELRQACRSPGFPSWLAVSRLQEPKKFADFVLGGSHLSPEEVRLHEEQYGLGGAFLEDQLFNLRTPDSLPAQ
ncbi:nuclear envelope integral membrane protein 2 [Bos javanicus]|uniref:nuclear envelope integral membrane protein 2 n=1 Tax=Bos javanicus TaxID=9906 RepID=UPI002AA7DD85|nr:nuclear envelope integral membrane protein 2 [Bos javanicus]XP_061288673.1 nuclear envelope integral membrane protein 2 [Bos javanicus]XP_061288682.1 nuclear envelope integral membrane protein 2 [Bos javanicus]XP_061288691.1 nuclear envelope integral membrane protein 2 [Bos javanicus]XP_061288699.1 nuclear envelope integral membrane protein 2 [Bos javanicus]